MALLPLRMSVLAATDIEVLREYHRARVAQFDLALGALLQQLQEFSGAYPRCRGSLRRILTPRFYLAVYYRILADHILIVVVTDQRQDPRRLRLYAPPR